MGSIVVGELEAPVVAMRSRVAKNLRFGIALGLTSTARFASEKMQAQLPAIFDRPTPFTQRGIAFQPATKAKLEARVFVREVQAQYLEMQETGGTRQPMPGKPITLAVGQRLNRFGNIPKGSIARTRAREDVFFANGKDARSRHLPPGIYRRLKTGGRKRKGAQAKASLKLLVAYETSAKYKPHFRFVERVRGIARDNVRREIEAAIAKAMATAR
jgi:hypothetical protein